MAIMIKGVNKMYRFGCSLDPEYMLYNNTVRNRINCIPNLKRFEAVIAMGIIALGKYTFPKIP
jgi:hypothetical protein